MAYPRKPKQEDTNADYRTKLPEPPAVPSVEPPRVISPQGGAPKLDQTRPERTAVEASAALRRAWNMTGTPQAFERALHRTQFGVEAEVVAESLNKYWQGVPRAQVNVPMPVPPAMSLEEAQQQLKNLSTALKARLDARFASLHPQEIAQSRFWQMYQQYPEWGAVLMARTLWTRQMVSQGPIADWLAWLRS